MVPSIQDQSSLEHWPYSKYYVKHFQMSSFIQTLCQPCEVGIVMIISWISKLMIKKVKIPSPKMKNQWNLDYIIDHATPFCDSNCDTCVLGNAQSCGSCVGGRTKAQIAFLECQFQNEEKLSNITTCVCVGVCYTLSWEKFKYSK